MHLFNFYELLYLEKKKEGNKKSTTFFSCDIKVTLLSTLLLALLRL